MLLINTRISIINTSTTTTTTATITTIAKIIFFKIPDVSPVFVYTNLVGSHQFENLIKSGDRTFGRRYRTCAFAVLRHDVESSSFLKRLINVYLKITFRNCSRC